MKCEDCKGFVLCYVHWCIKNWKLGKYGAEALAEMNKNILAVPVIKKEKKR